MNDIKRNSILVTVFMPVYNGSKYLQEAIESILNQSYQNFELLIINDGSTDNSEDIILSFTDSRIRYVANKTNIGLIGTLNIGINSAKGEYIARMDQDDFSLCDRIEKQVEFLNTNKEIGLVGTAFKFIGDENYHSYFLDNDNIKLALLFYNSLSHPSVMFRKEICIQHSMFFREEYIHAEDYKMWTDFIIKTKVANLPEVLINYRKHETQISQVYKMQQKNMAAQIQEEYLLNNGFTFSVRELNLIQKLDQLENSGDLELFMLMDKFYAQNQKLLFFNGSILSTFLLKIYKQNLLEIEKIDKELKTYLKTSLLFSKLIFSIRQNVSLKLKELKNKLLLK